MRQVLVILHRWAGLTIALFLFVAGITGAVISWDHELDALLNPQFYEAHTRGTPRPSLELARRIEQDDPRVRVTYLPLSTESGSALTVSVEPRADPVTGSLHDVGYNQVALDPVTGAVQARREWGAISLSRENLLPFLYKLHYSLHLPITGTMDWGVWLMGVIGIVWVVDCWIALALSFPNRRSWRKSFAFRWREGGARLNFDLHRSGGVWVWLVLLMMAVTSVSMNLGSEVMRPVVSWVSTLSPSPFDTRVPVAAAEPEVSPEAVLATAAREAERRAWTAPAGGLFYSSEFKVYGVGFFEPGEDHGAGLGNPWLYFDSRTGVPVGADVPGQGSPGDIFMQAQFPLHSGRILGVTGRVLISAMGLIVALLSVTGIVIWARKRAARSSAELRADISARA
jgi:uncharacterized iron-regulated membrane protein